MSSYENVEGGEGSYNDIEPGGHSNTGALATYATTQSSKIDPDKEMQAIYQKQLADFNLNKAPLIDELEASIDDTSISDRANVESSRLNSRSHAMASRLDGGRANTLLASQRSAKGTNIDRATSLGAASISTTGKRVERSNRVATRQQLSGIAEQLTANGTASMAQAAEQKRIRDAQNKAASKSALSGVLSIAGTVIGGMAGPVGAAAGGAIGGYIGGSI